MVSTLKFFEICRNCFSFEFFSFSVNCFQQKQPQFEEMNIRKASLTFFLICQKMSDIIKGSQPFFFFLYF